MSKKESKLTKNQKKENYSIICDEYFARIDYQSSAKSLNEKKIEYSILNLIEKIMKTGYKGEIPTDHKEKGKLYLQILESKIPFELMGEKPTYQLKWNAETNTFVEKKISQEIIKKIKNVLAKHNFEVIFEILPNLICQNKKNMKVMFLHLSNETNSTLELPFSIFSKFLSNYKILLKTNYTIDNSLDIEFNVGALTKYGWHAFEKDEVRINAIKKRIMIEGVKPTLGTLESLKIKWQNNQKLNKYIPIIENDVKWIKNNFPIHDSVRKKLDQEFQKMISNNQELSKIIPDMKFILNCNN